MSLRNSLDDDKWPSGGTDCFDCEGAPPPLFNLPPPPCPPEYELSLGVVPISCPSAMRSREEQLPQEQNLQLGVVFFTVGAMAALGTVVLMVFCGYRIFRSRGPKSGAGPLHGAIIYDDLHSSPGLHPMSFYDPSRGSNPRSFKDIGVGFPLGSKESPVSDSLSTALYRYTPEPRRMGIPPEHLYSSISSGSGSENFTCSTSDGVSSEVRSLLPHHPGHSPAPTTTTDSEEDDSLTPFLRGGVATDDTDSLNSPSHGRYYLHVPLTSLRPSPHREYLSGAPRRKSMTSSLSSGERELPPLPSRRDKFRIYSPQGGVRGRRGPRYQHYTLNTTSSPQRGETPHTFDRSKLINRFSHIYQNT